jgi:very-short-patch-repair endonuclease
MSEVRNPCRSGKSDLARAIARLAESQGGHVTRTQLLALGLGKGAIDGRIGAGRLFQVHRGVYAVGHLPNQPIDRARGALLAVGPRSALSGRSAASYWRLYVRWTFPLELTSPLRHRLPTIRTRRCSTLLSRDIRVCDGITVTSPARTLLDIAPQTAARTLHRFHNELRMRRLVDNEQLVDVAVRNLRHPGARRLLMLAGASAGEAKRSGFEVDWQWFARRYELPEYEINVELAGRRVDVLFTAERLIIELDGWGTHGTRHAFEQDRQQDSGILAATGIPTMRITYSGLHRRPREQSRRIMAILARRPAHAEVPDRKEPALARTR